MNTNLKTRQNTVKRDDKLFALGSKLITNDFYEGKWDIPANLKDLNANLFTINKVKSLKSKLKTQKI